MDHKELYQLLELPSEVISKLDSYEQTRNFHFSEELLTKILNRTTWDEGIKELQNLLGEDSDGFKILWELLNITGTYTYEQYKKRKISNDIFVATMKFVSRFLNEHLRTHGTYKFCWAWWFPRQLSAIEFRIGALEYELVEGESREIAVHIPSDADFTRESVLNSLRDFDTFRKAYFPEWKEVSLTCDTWMLASALEELLDENSNILAFKHLFQIDHVDLDATWFMGWIFPGYETIDEKLPEKTSLQRKAKEYLLSGKKIGVAKGHLNDTFLRNMEI